MTEEEIKALVDRRDYTKYVPSLLGDESPKPGEFYITGMQMNNLQGQDGWHKYIGYVVQVRKKWGAWNSDLVILRHADGSPSACLRR